jgi:hypothetical protein
MRAPEGAHQRQQDAVLLRRRRLGELDVQAEGFAAAHLIDVRIDEILGALEISIGFLRKTILDLLLYVGHGVSCREGSMHSAWSTRSGEHDKKMETMENIHALTSLD